MNQLRAVVAVEARLLFREPITWLAAVALPSGLLLVFGLIFGSNGPDPALGGYRWIEIFVPSLLVISLAVLGVQTLPIRLATYREKGFLRRLSTTPARPINLLVAQLIIYSVTSMVAVMLLIVVGQVGFAIPVPREPLGFVAAFLVGMTSLYAIGLLVAAISPSARVATSIAIPAFFVVMLLGGVYVPRYLLPGILQQIGNFTPPGVEGLLHAWLGAMPQLMPLIGMGLVTLVIGALAVRLFRWE